MGYPLSSWIGSWRSMPASATSPSTLPAPPARPTRSNARRKFKHFLGINAWGSVGAVEQRGDLWHANARAYIARVDAL